MQEVRGLTNVGQAPSSSGRSKNSSKIHSKPVSVRCRSPPLGITAYGSLAYLQFLFLQHSHFSKPQDNIAAKRVLALYQECTRMRLRPSHPANAFMVLRLESDCRIADIGGIVMQVAHSYIRQLQEKSQMLKQGEEMWDLKLGPGTHGHRAKSSQIQYRSSQRMACRPVAETVAYSGLLNSPHTAYTQPF